MFDPKWITDALKTGTGNAAAVAVACAFLAFGGDLTSFPRLQQLDPWIEQLSLVGTVIFGAIAVAGFIAFLCKRSIRVIRPFQRWHRRRRRRENIQRALSELSPVEWEILAYLVTRGQRMFTATLYGERAVTLIARGLIHLAAQRGQRMSVLETPFAVEEQTWSLLQEHREDFQHPDPNAWPPWNERAF